MKLSDIARLRLSSQRLCGSTFTKPEQVVTWMGALQAQDLSMALWAVGVRMGKATAKSVTAALHKGSILRTHLLRPTWHLVPARDIRWMLDLTAPQVKRGIASRHRNLRLTPVAISKSHAIIERTLSRMSCATRPQLSEALVNEGFSTGDNRMAHLLLMAELDQIICSGPFVNEEPTYTLMRERITHPVRMEREEALETLLTRYLQGHGPATQKDYAWWSGLAMEDVRRSFEMVRKTCVVTRVDGTEYWYRADLRDATNGEEEALLLPAFDEFTIAYVDRSASIVGDRARMISSNGIFRPMVVVDGHVVGIWRRERTKRGVAIQVKAFVKLSRAVRAALERAAERYARFAGHPAELTINEGGA